MALLEMVLHLIDGNFEDIVPGKLTDLEGLKYILLAGRTVDKLL